MIEIKGLTKRFGRVTALDRMNCTIEEGSVFGLVGSNGAGKSTLLRILAGIYLPDGGEVHIDNMPVFENPVVKGRVFFVPDFPYFFPQSTLADMVPWYSYLPINNCKNVVFPWPLRPINPSFQSVSSSKDTSSNTGS